MIGFALKLADPPACTRPNKLLFPCHADNINGHENPTGFRLKKPDLVAYNKFLASEAHKLGLAIGLKNGLVSSWCTNKIVELRRGSSGCRQTADQGMCLPGCDSVGLAIGLKNGLVSCCLAGCNVVGLAIGLKNGLVSCCCSTATLRRSCSCPAHNAAAAQHTPLARAACMWPQCSPQDMISQLAPLFDFATCAAKLRFYDLINSPSVPCPLRSLQDMVPQLASLFDFAINEECFSFSECGAYAGYFRNKPIVVIE